MKYEISKELFEEVMGFKTKSINISRYIFWEMDDEYKPNNGIPTDTFFFKCFDWAYKNGYILSFCTNDLSRLLRYSCLAEPMDNSSNYKEILSHDAHQTVFDVCQWILDNKVK